jgi:uncharacterized protein (DUF4415 family)
MDEVFYTQYFVVALMYVSYYTYIQMAKKKRQTRPSKKRTIGRLKVSGAGSNPTAVMEQFPGYYRPIKKPVTLRLDADVLAWFKKEGDGYQTRINGVLRKIMTEESKKPRD